jgi:hypothetical protein
MRFELGERESKLAREFMNKKRLEYTGAIGGQFTYEFTPTSLGLGCAIIDNVSKERCDLTDYESW